MKKKFVISFLIWCVSIFRFSIGNCLLNVILIRPMTVQTSSVFYLFSWTSAGFRRSFLCSNHKATENCKARYRFSPKRNERGLTITISLSCCFQSRQFNFVSFIRIKTQINKTRRIKAKKKKRKKKKNCEKQPRCRFS